MSYRRRPHGVPDRPLLVGVGDLEERFLASGPPSYLETNGQALGTERTGHRDWWSAGDIEGVGPHERQTRGSLLAGHHQFLSLTRPLPSVLRWQ